MKLSGISILNDQDVSALEQKFLVNGDLRVPSASEYKLFSQEQISIFCVKNAFYGLPTEELIQWIKQQIGNKTAIEIGAGNGALGRALSIPMSDSFLQDQPEVRAYYESLKQPTIRYGKDVEKLDYKEAIQKYRPEIVIGNWVTQLWRDHSDDGNASMHGLDEDWILKNVPCYIHVGNIKTHGRKRILKTSHQQYKFDWLISRSTAADECVIYVWDQAGK